jgi:hypothetical protein
VLTVRRPWASAIFPPGRALRTAAGRRSLEAACGSMLDHSQNRRIAVQQDGLALDPGATGISEDTDCLSSAAIPPAASCASSDVLAGTLPAKVGFAGLGHTCGDAAVSFSTPETRAAEARPPRTSVAGFLIPTGLVSFGSPQRRFVCFIHRAICEVLVLLAAH